MRGAPPLTSMSSLTCSCWSLSSPKASMIKPDGHTAFLTGVKVGAPLHKVTIRLKSQERKLQVRNLFVFPDYYKVFTLDSQFSSILLAQH